MEINSQGNEDWKLQFSKKINEHTQERKSIQCSLIRRLNVVKTSIIPEANYRFNQFLSKAQWFFFCRKEKYILTFLQNFKISWIDKNNLENEKRGLTLPDFKSYYIAMVITTVWYRHNNIHETKENNR